MNQHIINRFDPNTVCSGVLRMINQPSMFEKFRKYIESEWIYSNDSSDVVVAIRKVIDLMHILYNEGKFKEMTLTLFDSYIDAKFVEEKTRQLVGGHFRSWVRSEVIRAKMDDDGCFEAFLDYIRILQIAKRSKGFNEAYQHGDIIGASDIMRDIVHTVTQISNQSEIKTFDADEALEQFQSPDNFYANQTVYLGCDPLDHNIGGFQPETLNIFISTTNGGKTAMCHHILRRCVELKIKAYVACVEDREKSFRVKLVAACTGISMHRLKNRFDELLTDELASVKKALADIKEYLRIDFIYGEGVEDIHKRMLAYDMDCRASKKPVPLVNIIDYTGHIMSKSIGDKTYEKARNAYASRKDFALKHKKICFDFAQVNREGSKRLVESNKCLSHTDLAGSFDLSQVCDNIISINRDATDIADHKARLHISKCRDGETEKTYQVQTEFHKYRFNMDKVIWQNVTEEQQKRFEEEKSGGKS